MSGIVGGGRRRKLQILRETLRPGAVIAEVARRHGIGTRLLYTSRKAMLATGRIGTCSSVMRAEPSDDPPPPGNSGRVMAAAVATRTKPAAGRVEIEFPNGVRVRIDGSVDETVLRSIRKPGF
ncbi:MAG: transposase, partial [Acetobacteraceae bacterium]|nr:transposase [Acetobacteraceae bacterium]